MAYMTEASFLTDVFLGHVYCTVSLTVLQWVLGYCTVRPLEALSVSDGWGYLPSLLSLLYLSYCTVRPLEALGLSDGWTGW